eukprot:TRINITY_DN428_c0_g1_i22.p1 TRINITY_DN428_c0_g1~~TRINITY_DN428_c0_g1_i22.p1  ORF type:complete len:209 (-),score=63.71 TRINITY_DN428_c0_g1_i22:8-634(-)
MNTENAKRRIAMRNKRRWKRIMEDIGVLRDVLREVCERLIIVEKKSLKKDEEDEEYFSCVEESEEEEREEDEKKDRTGGMQEDEQQGEERQKDKEMEAEKDGMNVRVIQVGPEPLADSEENTEEWSQLDGQDKSDEEGALSESELDEEEKDIIPNYPFSRKNPGPYSKAFIREVMTNGMERLEKKIMKIAEKAERLKDPNYFRNTSTY